MRTKTTGKFTLFMHRTKCQTSHSQFTGSKSCWLKNKQAMNPTINTKIKTFPSQNQYPQLISPLYVFTLTDFHSHCKSNSCLNLSSKQDKPKICNTVSFQKSRFRIKPRLLENETSREMKIRWSNQMSPLFKKNQMPPWIDIDNTRYSYIATVFNATTKFLVTRNCLQAGVQLPYRKK
jgi:hypothetical protein